jgi:hypothetical protein
MVVAVFVTMLPAVQIMAASNGKMSRLLLIWLFLLLDLVMDAGCFIGSLALLKKGYEPKRVHGHCFICFGKLVLVPLGLRKED